MSFVIMHVPLSLCSYERLSWKEVVSDMDVIRAIEKEQMKKDIPQFNVGDTVRVYVKVVEGSRERLQAFEGVVIQKEAAAFAKPLPYVDYPTA